MRRLLGNFYLERYGLKVRLVNENDADFILSLRSNPDRTKYMLTLDDNIANQKKWIQDYKAREEKGLDYYLIYSNSSNKPIGLNRISKVDFSSSSAKASSWITIEGLNFESFKMLVIQSEIVFDYLRVEALKGEIHKNNNTVIKVFNLFDYKFEEIHKDYYHFTIDKKDVLKACENRIIRAFLNKD